MSERQQSPIKLFDNAIHLIIARRLPLLGFCKSDDLAIHAGNGWFRLLQGESFNQVDLIHGQIAMRAPIRTGKASQPNEPILAVERNPPFETPKRDVVLTRDLCLWETLLYSETHNSKPFHRERPLLFRKRSQEGSLLIARCHRRPFLCFQIIPSYLK